MNDAAILGKAPGPGRASAHPARLYVEIARIRPNAELLVPTRHCQRPTTA